MNFAEAQSSLKDQTALFNQKSEEFEALKLQVKEQIGKLEDKESLIVFLRGEVSRLKSEKNEKDSII